MWKQIILCFTLIAGISSQNAFDLLRQMTGSPMNTNPNPFGFGASGNGAGPMGIDPSLISGTTGTGAGAGAGAAAGAGMGLAMSRDQMALAALQAAPSVQTICETKNRMLNPRDAKGILSDVVGNEIAARSRYLQSFPQLAGTGAWGCAATYYAARHTARDLGNIFGDLIDSTGCDGFTCNPLTGVTKLPQMNQVMNAMLMASLFNQNRNTMAGQPTAPQMPNTQTGTAVQGPQQPAQPSQPAGTPPPTPQSTPPQNQTPQPAVQPPAQPPVQQSPPPPATQSNSQVDVFQNPMFLEQLRQLVARFQNQNSQPPQMPGFPNFQMPNMPGLYF